MKSNKMWLLLAFALTLSAVFLVSSVHATGIDGGYVGTSTCLSCHDGSVPGAADRTSFTQTGHPWKYKHTGGTTPPNTWDPLSSLFPRPATATDISTTSLNDLIVTDGAGKLDWSAINYTIGGFGWKIRWGVRDFDQDGDGVNETGYVWAGSKTQYNLEGTGGALDPKEWSQYPATIPSNKKYECAKCHNTNGIVSTAGYSCFTDGGTDAAPVRTEPWASNPGMGPVTKGGYYSSWTFDGVQCEACHGKGSNATNNGHADGTGTQGVLTLAGGVEICAKCHIRAENTSGQGAECDGSDNPAILTNGAKITDPWIGHHEQYNEMHGYNEDGVHASLTCTTCHDPHKRAAGVIAAVETALGIAPGTGSQPAAGAIIKQCADCHLAQNTLDVTAATGSAQEKHLTAGVTCADCHMAEATKTATNFPTTGWGRKGDLKTHIFKINPAGSSIVRSNGFTNIAEKFVTPKYACGKCHDSAIYGSVIAGPASEAEAQTAAANYHGATGYGLDPAAGKGYVGSNICSVCHTDQFNDFVQSGHPYKLRITDGATPTSETDPLSALLTNSGGNTIASVVALNYDASVCVDADLNGKCDVGSPAIDADSDGKLDWSAVNYVIGGWGWKARWGINDASGNDKTGLVWSAASLVGGFGAQFNMLAADTSLDTTGNRADWSTYGSASGQGKKYQCAMCHNTNGVIINADPDHLDCKSSSVTSERTEPWASTSMTYASHGGFYSEFTFSGVQCEACHGPASTHIKTQLAADIVKNTSKDVCGKCHIRATNTTVTNAGSKNDECSGDMNAEYLNNGAPSTANDFNGHHEQYNEMVGVNGDGVHASLDCVDCHNPHKRSHQLTNAVAGALGITDNNLSAEARGAVVSCESCHGTGTPLAAAGGADTKIATTQHLPGRATCIDCHMGEITKSATGVKGTWGKMGDVKGHIFKIDPTLTANTRLNGDGKTVATDYITVDYACGKCHDSAMGSSYVGFTLSQAQASAVAVGMHASAGVSYPVTFTTSVPANGLTVNVVASVNCSGDATCLASTFSYDWDWDNDGTANNGPATTASASHTYATAGAKSIKLTVSITAGTVGSVTRSVTIANPDLPPVANATCAWDANTWGMVVTNTSTDDGPDGDMLPGDGSMQIVVDWGDGTAKDYTVPYSHVYNTTGTFPVTLKATDSKLQTSTYTCTAPNLATPAYFSISGTVKKSVAAGGANIASATVQLLNGTTNAVIKSVLTGTGGTFSLGTLKPGIYKLKFVKSGYVFPAPGTPVTNPTITVGPTSSGSIIRSTTP
ncbi:MAG: hypothetical protein AB1499_05045 [Nitrospirota bacterium]